MFYSLLLSYLLYCRSFLICIKSLRIHHWTTYFLISLAHTIIGHLTLTVSAAASSIVYLNKITKAQRLYWIYQPTIKVLQNLDASIAAICESYFRHHFVSFQISDRWIVYASKLDTTVCPVGPSVPNKPTHIHHGRFYLQTC